MGSDTPSKHTPEEKQPRNPANTLQGWPGYRTRAGRSGLDPLDSRAEAGHMGGIFLRDLLTGKLRTKKPVYLFLLGFFGLICVIPLAFTLVDASQGSVLPFGGWMLIGLVGILGILCLLNLFRNLF